MAARGPYTDEEKARIELLVNEGLPNTWIAEDIDRSIKSVQMRTVKLPGSAQRNEDWGHMWPYIMHDEELLRLHREIAPQSMKFAW